MAWEINAKIEMIMKSKEKEIGLQYVTEIITSGRVNERDAHGNTPLLNVVQWNIQNGQFLAEQLLKHQAEPNMVDRFGKGCLYYALHHRSLDMVHLLLEANADPNSRFESDKTLLHFCVLLDDRKIAQLLCTHKANPNAMDANGITPKMQAAALGKIEIFKILEKYGAPTFSVPILDKKAKKLLQEFIRG